MQVRAFIVGLLVCLSQASAAQTFEPPSYLLHWGGPGSIPGQFIEPADVAIAPDGNVYVVDRGNHRVQAFTAEGTFLIAWGQNGEEDGWFVNPSGIDIDRDGNVYIADPTHPSDLRVFDTGGMFAGKIELPTYRVAVDAGEVYGTMGKMVRVHAPTGELLRSWEVQESPLGSFYDVCLLPDGRLAVTETYQDAIYVMDRDGNQRTTWGGDGTFGLPSGVASNGQFVYVADLGRVEVIVLTLDGSEVGAFPVIVPSHGLFAPVALDFDSHGDLYVVAGPYVVKYGSSTPVSETTWSKVKQLYRDATR